MTDKKKASKPKSKAARRGPPRGSAPKKRARTNRRSPAVRGPRSGRSEAVEARGWVWTVAEIGTWVGAIGVGLTLTAGMLWLRARSDVAAYLEAPPTAVPSVVWSAPMTVKTGMPADVAVFADDLLAAGYERVPHLLDSTDVTGEGVGLFALSEGTFDIWTSTPVAPVAAVGPVTEGRATIAIAEGRVVSVSRRGGVVLPPTVLGRIGELDDQRSHVELASVSSWVEPALLSMEDVRFRYHRGVDPIGLVRALFSNATTDTQQGGSTLTQQLAKNLFLSRDRTIRRKVRELFFASALEQALTKDELLELYLDEIYLGQMGGLPLHGVQQASMAWFGKGAARLELHEAALIIGVIPAPNTYSPIRHPEVAKSRRDLVLVRMHDLGEIDDGQLAAAQAQDLDLSGLEPSRVRRAPYAVDAAIERVEARLGQGVLARGIQIHTTIHPLFQRAAEEAIADGMAELDEDHPKSAGAQVALVAVGVETGSVVAMVGGRSYAESAYNRAMDAQRQVGSTIKPLTLVKAYADGRVTPATRLPDEPLTLDLGTETWTPKNYDGKYEGEVSLRRAIVASRNIPAVHLANRVGQSRLQRFYQSAGLSQATGLPSAALGSFPATPVEMAGAYTLFHRGIAHRPEVVASVWSAEGEELARMGAIPHSVVDPRAAGQAMDLLRGVITSGTGARASRYGVGYPAGGKTGTTDDYRDAWFVGLTPELSVAVWVGRDRDTLGLSGSRGALPTWSRFVAASGTLDAEPYVPEGLVSVSLCQESGQPVRNACPGSITEQFVLGTVPEERCEDHGGPQAHIGRLFGNLFKRRDRRSEAEDEEVVDTGVPEPPPERKRRRRDRKRD